MSTWLTGDLTGVNAKAELELLQRTVRDAVATGSDLEAFWKALAELDPVACAELAAGPRAIAEPAAVRSCLCVAPILEEVMSASGLYGRLVRLAPSEAGQIARIAARRHPSAGWVWRVGRSDARGLFEELCQHDETAAILAALQHDREDLALTRVAGADAGVLRGIYERAPAQVLERCLAAVFDAGTDQPVVAWLAAWHGPHIDSTLARVALRLGSDSGRQRLLSQATDLPITRRHLEAAHG